MTAVACGSNRAESGSAGSGDAGASATAGGGGTPDGGSAGSASNHDSGCDPSSHSSVEQIVTAGYDAPFESSAAMLFVDSGQIYWYTDEAGLTTQTLWTVPSTGGTPTKVARDEGYLDWLVPDGDVFWRAATDPLDDVKSVLGTMPRDGGAFKPIEATSGGGGVGDFVVDGENLYFISDTESQILSIPKTGGSPKILATETGVNPRAGEIVQDSVNLYWIDGLRNAVYSVPKAGGAMRTVLTTTPESRPETLTVDGTTLYVVSSGSSIVAISDGGPPVTIATGARASTGGRVAADATGAYWLTIASGGTGGSVMHWSPGAAAPVELTGSYDVGCCGGVVGLDDVYVYWWDNAGNIYRVRKDGGCGNLDGSSASSQGSSGGGAPDSGSDAGCVTCGGAKCVDTSSDRKNYGACGNTCSVVGEQCFEGSCTCLAPKSLSNGVCCAAGQTGCNGTCVDEQSDPDNCGGCGIACLTGDTCEAGTCKCSGTICGSACTLLASDPANCGRCGHSCEGGQCSAGICQAVTLASNEGIPRGLALDSTNLYWADEVDHVKKIALGGGSITVMASVGQTVPNAIVVDASNVYWTNSRSCPQCGNGEVLQMPLEGGTITTLASGGDPMAIAIDSTTVYWADAGRGTILKTPIGGGTVTTLASLQGKPYGIVVDAMNLYWTDNLGGRVLSMPIGGGTITTFASGQNGAANMAIDSTYVYWIVAGAIVKAPKTGGPTVTLASGQSQPMTIAVDSRGVYWTDFAGGAANAGSVMSVALSGGIVTTLAMQRTGPFGIVVDSTSVYWSEIGPGALMKLARP